MNEKEQKQVKMHADFFDRCKEAIQNEFYFEAVLMEYAAIEARLESICGVVGLPCGKDCPYRRDIKISSRISCLRSYCNKNPDIIHNSKLPSNFFSDHGELRTWIRQRDICVHGLFKDEVKYSDRIEANKDLATAGYEYARLLYNEAKRLRRIPKNHPEQFDKAVAVCKNKKCKAYHAI